MPQSGGCAACSSGASVVCHATAQGLLVVRLKIRGSLFPQQRESAVAFPFVRVSSRSSETRCDGRTGPDGRVESLARHARPSSRASGRKMHVQERATYRERRMRNTPAQPTSRDACPKKSPSVPAATSRKKEVLPPRGVRVRLRRGVRPPVERRSESPKFRARRRLFLCVRKGAPEFRSRPSDYRKGNTHRIKKTNQSRDKSQYVHRHKMSKEVESLT